MSREFDVLDANSAFYLAFSQRDVAAMDELWATSAPVACIHPGWDALRGRDDVMASWNAILNGPEPPEVRCTHAFAQVLGEAALVICREQIGEGELVATNVFVREGGVWKLVHHQASPLASDAESIAPDEPLN